MSIGRRPLHHCPALFSRCGTGNDPRFAQRTILNPPIYTHVDTLKRSRCFRVAAPEMSAESCLALWIHGHKEQRPQIVLEPWPI